MPTFTDDQFAALLRMLAPPATPGCSLGEATTRYIATKRRMAPATHATYHYVMRRWATESGWDQALSSLTKADVATYLATLKPGQAYNVAKCLRAFFRWAADQGLVAAPLLVRVTHKARGHVPWSPTDLDAYRARWPSGTRQRLVFEAALATGLRRSDLAAALWSKATTLATKKTGEQVWLGALEACRATYRAPLGRRLSGHSLGLKFTLWVRAAGLKGRSLHGLRKTFLQRAAEAGCSGPELMTLAGHKSLAMTSLYIRQVDRAALAKSALAKLAAR